MPGRTFLQPSPSNDCYYGSLGNEQMSSNSSRASNALLHGTLDALILKTLVRGPSHGYAIARFIEESTGDAVLIEDGSLYPALYRLELRGWVEAEWGTSELGRRAKLYRITDTGREQLAAAMATWKKFAAGVSKVLFAS
jgi:PadR family transcriptional regulator PadR